MTKSKISSNNSSKINELYAIAETSGQQFWFEVNRYYDIDRLNAKENEKIALEKVLLLKHKDSIISIYGRVKDIKVAKGDRIIPGQVIGSVEKSSIDEEKQNYLHFELRKGTESLDPEPLFQ